MKNNIGVSVNKDWNFPIETKFYSMFDDKEFKYLTNFNWLFDRMPKVELLDKRFKCLIKQEYRATGWKFFLFQIEETNTIMYLQITPQEISFILGGNNEEENLKIGEEIERLYPKIKRRTRVSVEMSMWMNTDGGVKRRDGYWDVVKFSSIENNYESGTLDVLKTLKDFKPKRSGQLFLFTGNPGTGKTYAIRTLAWEWRKWAKFYVIFDPLTLFQKPEYLAEILFQKEIIHMGPPDSAPKTIGDLDKMKRMRQDKEIWKIVVLEDMGKLLSKQRSEEMGRGWTSLINATDGIIGQGQKVLFLITTNESIDELHEAIGRPGRCALSHEFKKFSAVEAQKWLNKKGMTETMVKEESSLAELYNYVEKFQIKSNINKQKKKMGFIN